ncbi:hypothetical protein AGMMS49949_08930 [Alphaproteobacteria bacterium]|nr:hypothetical protein AGMMS49949_08930 [Alphaproteobacteria bacterium]GHS99902.1 hypothetical protein AGMMS50296_8160 [Alphaproteobacteria bacterium]
MDGTVYKNGIWLDDEYVPLEDKENTTSDVDGPATPRSLSPSGPNSLTDNSLLETDTSSKGSYTDSDHVLYQGKAVGDGEWQSDWSDCLD